MDQRGDGQPTTDRVVAGVATRLGDRLGVDPMFVRLAFIALAAAGGVGIIVYLVLWALGETRVATRRPVRPTTTRQAVALGFVLVGVVVLLRDVGLWFGDGLSWPIVAVALGSAVLWTRGDDARAGMDQVGPWRVLMGGALLVAGIGGVLVSSGSLGALVKVFVAMGVTVLGVALVLGPWLRSLVTELGAERRERVRQEERAAVATHLHDSVLQTLAMIQRSADQPTRTIALARRQERELRTWLYDGATAVSATTLQGRVAAIVEEVEDDHPVRVDAVVVGDADLGGPDPAAQALVGAVREAVVNAARHAGVDEVRVFVEVEPSRIVGWVLDRGVGFDPATVADDRRGIADSIRARVERVGGRCTLTTAPGAGTEVEVEVPHRAALTNPSTAP